MLAKGGFWAHCFLIAFCSNNFMFKNIPIIAHDKRIAFKRFLVPPKQRQGLLRFLEKKNLKLLFDGLPIIYNFSVRRTFFKGIPVIIKDTRGGIAHGFDFERARKAFLVHQKALRQGQIKAIHYKMKSPKVYGRIENFLIMEYVPTSPEEKKLFFASPAFKELKENFIILHRNGLIKEIPQLDAMPVKVESTKLSERKWLVFLPNDWL